MPTIVKPLMGRKRGFVASGDPGIGRDYRRVIGSYLRELRLAKGMTQRDLGEILGMGNTAISEIENGGSSLAPEHYAVVADLFGLSHHDLGNFLLRYTNPFLYGMIHGLDSTDLKDELERMTVNLPRDRRVTK